MIATMELPGLSGYCCRPALQEEVCEEAAAGVLLFVAKEDLDGPSNQSVAYRIVRTDLERVHTAVVLAVLGFVAVVIAGHRMVACRMAHLDHDRRYSLVG